ncbi:tyrosine-protein phosphatase [Colwellia sp. 4_MG-2023]|jgi:protein-tyrosine phosphatase|uniref:phosphatase domain-containing protein n=1 Tax=unclassified Colwellia TaxID=196834 RepID=UPI001C0984DE|nr:MULTISPECIES: dual specificity protein phosphatase family protein [unclassified Colwellia]MBU2926505.1 dual specificity protein phosphatase family protein [Colwellia sp. C2M11]MDO6487464.1 tyrosine-protein phosphatase [Colwellia sp. 6_MG-2023]MDO6508598.1 tyrosine-protein phosphatase [Colwellia sp. 5_MG-2023]MDO6557281.1 tyrosine-protein phosphatase [Colwellia sp. 4_MG-2023]MDO6652543.1 tyrosine-protein phosphatase [Colwellia sp. 3_MG-2023]
MIKKTLCLTHPFDTLPLDNGAQLIFTPCPGTKEADLVASIATLKNAGTNLLITLMFDEEMERNAVLSLPEECNKQGIQWLQLPILDDAEPNQAFETQWQVHKANIIKIINNKGVIAVHCKGGSGRTGLVIGLILLALGWSHEKIISEVQKLRPTSLKNLKQLNYFNSY